MLKKILLITVSTFFVLASIAYAKISAPILVVSGESLSWNRVEKYNDYVLITKVPGKAVEKTKIKATGITPIGIPGDKVAYQIKVEGKNVFSNEVSVNYTSEKPVEEEEENLEKEKKEEERKEKEEKEKIEKEEKEHKEEEKPEEEEHLESGVGKPKFSLDAASYFDKYGNAENAQWVKSHISLIVGYPPYSDKYVALFGVPLIGYHDDYTEGFAPLSPSSRARYVERVIRDKNAGYAGTFMDDVNFAGGNIPGSRAELANLIENVRTALGPEGILEINAQYHDIWPLMKAHDPDVERALKQVNLVTKEFGVGPTAGINSSQDYKEFFEYVEVLRSKGIHVTMTGDYQNNNVHTMEYNLATYFLVNDGKDYVNGHEQVPGNFWKGFEVNLGEPTSSRERSSTGIWERKFTGGLDFTDEPNGATQTIKLPETMENINGEKVTSVTLSAQSGAILKYIGFAKQTIFVENEFSF